MVSGNPRFPSGGNGSETLDKVAGHTKERPCHSGPRIRAMQFYLVFPTKGEVASEHGIPDIAPPHMELVRGWGSKKPVSNMATKGKKENRAITEVWVAGACFSWCLLRNSPLSCLESRRLQHWSLLPDASPFLELPSCCCQKRLLHEPAMIAMFECRSVKKPIHNS